MKVNGFWRSECEEYYMKLLYKYMYKAEFTERSKEKL